MKILSRVWIWVGRLKQPDVSFDLSLVQDAGLQRIPWVYVSAKFSAFGPPGRPSSLPPPSAGGPRSARLEDPDVARQLGLVEHNHVRAHRHLERDMRGVRCVERMSRIKRSAWLMRVINGERAARRSHICSKRLRPNAHEAIAA